MRKEIWIVIILAIIMVVLIGVLFLVPRNFDQGRNPLTGTDGLAIYSLRPNQEISSPLKITGQVRGNGWAGFEGQVGTVSLLDGNGKTIALGILTATTEWTTLPTYFEVTLNFQSPVVQTGTLIFKNENASGLPDKERTFILPVKIPKVETMMVKAYFNNNVMDPEVSCTKVFAVDRQVPKTTATANAAISELLKGPTDAEKSQGYTTTIPVGSKLNSISIINGEAKVDFDATTESGGGSCSMASRVAQITQTLLQFPTITSVKLSINGRTGDIFQP